MRDAEHHSWTQTLQDLDVRVRIPTGTPAKMIACDIKKKHLTFGLKGQPPMIDGELFGELATGDCFWTLEDKSTVLLNLSKRNDMEWWSYVVKGDPVIDTKKVTPENSKLSDLDGDTRQRTVEKMMYDQRQKQMGLPTSEEQQKQETMRKFMEAHPEMDFSNCKFSKHRGDGVRDGEASPLGQRGEEAIEAMTSRGPSPPCGPAPR